MCKVENIRHEMVHTDCSGERQGSAGRETTIKQYIEMRYAFSAQPDIIPCLIFSIVFRHLYNTAIYLIHRCRFCFFTFSVWSWTFI